MPQIWEGGKLDNTYPDGVGKPSDDQENLPSPQPVVIPSATVVIDHDSKLKAHSVEIAGMLARTAHYGGHGSLYPTATGSRIPSEPADNDYAQSGVEQQNKPDTDND
jgi:hypothetical protein